jgi:hypothetical protein
LMSRIIIAALAFSTCSRRCDLMTAECLLSSAVSQNSSFYGFSLLLCIRVCSARLQEVFRQNWPAAIDAEALRGCLIDCKIP